MRDSEGRYSPTAPFWAPVTAASYLTAPTSDRKVLAPSHCGHCVHPRHAMFCIRKFLQQ